MDINQGDSPATNAHNQSEVEDLLTGDTQPG